MQGWKAFFEEPVMLIAFVLLGRNLEQRAKIKATSDMTGLLSLLPSKARLVVNGDIEESSSTVEVPCNSLSVGDQIVILPGVSKIHYSHILSLSPSLLSLLVLVLDFLLLLTVVYNIQLRRRCGIIILTLYLDVNYLTRAFLMFRTASQLMGLSELVEAQSTSQVSLESLCPSLNYLG